MVGGMELSSYAVGLRFAAIIVALYVLSHLYDSSKRVSEMERAVVGFTIKRGRLSSSGSVSAPVFARRDRAFVAWCLIPAL